MLKALDVGVTLPLSPERLSHIPLYPLFRLLSSTYRIFDRDN